MSANNRLEGACRNVTLDVVRGLGILIVVYGHALQSVNGMVAGMGLHEYILQFQMPLLMMVSGFTATFKSDESFWQGLKRRTKRLLVPYLFWVGVCMVLDLLRTGGVHVLRELYCSQFWFLRILFLVAVSFSVGEWIWRCGAKMNTHLRLLTSAAVVLALYKFVAMVPGQENVFSMGVHYAVGYCVARVIPKVSSKGWWLIVLLAVFYIGINVLEHRVAFRGRLSLLALGGASLVWVVADCVRRFLPDMSDRIGAIGRNTLPIYAIHWCLLFRTNAIDWSFLHNVNISIAGGLVCVLWMAVTLGIIHVASQAKWSRLLILSWWK